jgi:putative colanic acid biosynthesis glycosyltransferase WcaI
LTFLFLNQTFYPDVMATGQYLTEVAVRLVERGHQVTVVTGRRAYDQPGTQFPKTETWRGIHIYRVGSTGFGKGAKWKRLVDFASYLVACCWRLAWLPKHDAVVALTTPPLISFIGAWLARFWRASFFYWVMDFNPDQAVAAGWLRAESIPGRLLERMSRFSLRQAKKVIALDRFMRDLIVTKGIPPAKVAVIPPWSHDTEVKFDPEGRDRFRQAHGLDGKFVVMYSGNHSPCHPLDTLLAASRQLASNPEVVFCFVGGGSEWRKIREEAESRKQKAEIGRFSLEPSAIGLPTIMCLPYQPFDQLAGSLSAADLHVVVLGNAFVGLVHPCKIYNILSVGAPVLYIGPRPSHLSEVLDPINDDYPCAAAAHGEVDRVVEQIERIRRQPRPASRQPPARVCTRFSKEALLPRLTEELESA